MKDKQKSKSALQNEPIWSSSACRRGQAVDWVDQQGNLYPAVITDVSFNEITARLDGKLSTRIFRWDEVAGEWTCGGMALLPRRNLVLCRSCLTALESTYRHDFVMCGCENHTFVDGGLDYTRIGGADLSLVEVLDSVDGIRKPRGKTS